MNPIDLARFTSSSVAPNVTRLTSRSSVSLLTEDGAPGRVMIPGRGRTMRCACAFRAGTSAAVATAAAPRKKLRRDGRSIASSASAPPLPGRRVRLDDDVAHGILDT